MIGSDLVEHNCSTEFPIELDGLIGSDLVEHNCSTEVGFPLDRNNWEEIEFSSPAELGSHADQNDLGEIETSPDLQFLGSVDWMRYNLYFSWLTEDLSSIGPLDTLTHGEHFNYAFPLHRSPPTPIPKDQLPVGSTNGPSAQPPVEGGHLPEATQPIVPELYPCSCCGHRVSLRRLR